MVRITKERSRGPQGEAGERGEGEAGGEGCGGWVESK